MKRFSAFVSLIAAVVLVASPVVKADRKPFVFDRNHSQINFVAEALLITAHGFFERWDGDIQIDAGNLENSTLRIEIETASINTRVEARDNDLRSARFFDAQNYPKITFVSTKVKKVDDKNLLVTGDLTIRGVTKSIEAPIFVVFLRDGRGRFKGEFKINRQDFQVSGNSRMNPIEDMVTVQLDLNLLDQQVQQQRQQQRQQQQQQPPAPPPPQKPPQGN